MNLARISRASRAHLARISPESRVHLAPLPQLSNEQIDGVVAELHRAANTKAKSGLSDSGEPLPLVYELMLDNSSCRKKLNDYTEGLLVQVAQKMDTFKGAYEASKQGKKEGKGTFFTPRKF